MSDAREALEENYSIVPRQSSKGACGRCPHPNDCPEAQGFKKCAERLLDHIGVLEAQVENWQQSADTLRAAHQDAIERVRGMMMARQAGRELWAAASRLVPWPIGTNEDKAHPYGYARQVALPREAAVKLRTLVEELRPVVGESDE